MWCLELVQPPLLYFHQSVLIFLCVVVKVTLCACDTTHGDTGITTLTPTNKAINKVTLEINK